MTRTGTGVFRNPMAPAATMAAEKLPVEFLERTVVEMHIGEHVVVDASAMAVDPELNCWLNPDAIFEMGTTMVNTTAPCIGVAREPRGFVVSLHGTKGHRWRVGPRPETINGREWIRVVELKY